MEQVGEADPDTHTQHACNTHTARMQHTHTHTARIPNTHTMVGGLPDGLLWMDMCRVPASGTVIKSTDRGGRKEGQKEGEGEREGGRNRGRVMEARREYT